MRASAAQSPFIRLDPRARDTLQSQIYAAVRRAILDGTLQPGAPLVSSRALAIDLGVSRTTTLLAFEQLTAEGYLTAHRGSGTFVTRELPDDLPRVRIVRPAMTTLKHPPMSRRGAALAAVPAPAKRVGRAPCAFRIGVPALDLFPMRQWTELSTRRLRSVTLRQLDYGDANGLPELREAIADHVRRARGTTCSADQVIVAAGAQRGIELMCQMLLDEGDTACVEDPGYPGARSALLSAGARVVPVRVDGDGLDVDVIARQTDVRVVYVTPSHQFPLGVPMSLSRRLALLRWASAARAWIIEDDYDSEFRYGARAIPCLHGLDADGRVIYVGTFSKTLFPALRLGFVIVPPDLIERVRALRRAGEQHPPMLDQAVLADFMAGGHFDRHLRRMRAAYQERVEALSAAAERHAAGLLRLRPVRTGLHAVADLDDGTDDVAVCREAAARGVEAMPLSAYALGRTKVNGLMLGFAAVVPDALHRGMERLAAAVEAAARGESRAAARAPTRR